MSNNHDSEGLFPSTNVPTLLSTLCSCHLQRGSKGIYVHWNTTLARQRSISCSEKLPHQSWRRAQYHRNICYWLCVMVIWYDLLYFVAFRIISRLTNLKNALGKKINGSRRLQFQTSFPVSFGMLS